MRRDEVLADVIRRVQELKAGKAMVVFVFEGKIVSKTFRVPQRDTTLGQTINALEEPPFEWQREREGRGLQK